MLLLLPRARPTTMTKNSSGSISVLTSRKCRFAAFLRGLFAQMVAREDHRLLQWQYFPKSSAAPSHLRDVIKAFETVYDQISSSQHTLPSDSVLAVLHEYLAEIGFTVEISKRKQGRIGVAVLFGQNGRPEKSFYADAVNQQSGTVIEVEAGRAVVNNQFLKDLFQACMMHDISYLVIAVRQTYKGGRDFETVVMFLDTLYASQRMTLPLKGILIVGY